MSNDSPQKTIGIALAVCLICSILVATAAVGLRKIQKANQNREKVKNILMAGGIDFKNKNLQKVYHEKIRSELIELKSGRTLLKSEYKEDLQPETFDIKTTPYKRRIDPDKDLAKIQYIPIYMVVYQVIEKDRMDKIILPIYGKGLWSTMYGFIALDRDLRTIKGFTFYEQGETPGLGGEVDNPRWKRIWVGKQAFDSDGHVRIRVIKGKVDPESPNAKYEIDGLSGSTLTTRGVDQMIQFWLGENGYAPFLNKLREQLSLVS
jgi:Na+-transporting NADH:ubiquinone oxidoreductase subunit C